MKNRWKDEKMKKILCKVISILLVATFITGQISTSFAYDNLAASLATDPDINPHRSKFVQNDIAGKAEPSAIANGTPLLNLAQGKLPTKIDLSRGSKIVYGKHIRKAIMYALGAILSAQKKGAIPQQHLQRVHETVDNLVLLNNFLWKRGYLFNAVVLGKEDYLLGFNSGNQFGYSIELIDRLYSISSERLAQYLFHECVPEKGIITERDDHRAVYNEIQSAIFGQDEVLALKRDLRGFINERALTPAHIEPKKALWNTDIKKQFHEIALEDIGYLENSILKPTDNTSLEKMLAHIKRIYVSLISKDQESSQRVIKKLTNMLEHKDSFVRSDAIEVVDEIAIALIKKQKPIPSNWIDKIELSYFNPDSYHHVTDKVLLSLYDSLFKNGRGEIVLKRLDKLNKELVRPDREPEALAAYIRCLNPIYVAMVKNKFQLNEIDIKSIQPYTSYYSFQGNYSKKTDIVRKVAAKALSEIITAYVENNMFELKDISLHLVYFWYRMQMGEMWEVSAEYLRGFAFISSAIRAKFPNLPNDYFNDIFQEGLAKRDDADVRSRIENSLRTEPLPKDDFGCLIKVIKHTDNADRKKDGIAALNIISMACLNSVADSNDPESTLTNTQNVPDEVVDFLSDLLDDKVAFVRAEAAEALGNIIAARIKKQLTEFPKEIIKKLIIKLETDIALDMLEADNDSVGFFREALIKALTTIFRAWVSQQREIPEDVLTLIKNSKKKIRGGIYLDERSFEYHTAKERGLLDLIIAQYKNNPLDGIKKVNTFITQALESPNSSGVPAKGSYDFLESWTEFLSRCDEKSAMIDQLNMYVEYLEALILDLIKNDNIFRVSWISPLINLLTTNCINLPKNCDYLIVNSFVNISSGLIDKDIALPPIILNTLKDIIKDKKGRDSFFRCYAFKKYIEINTKLIEKNKNIPKSLLPILKTRNDNSWHPLNNEEELYHLYGVLIEKDIIFQNDINKKKDAPADLMIQISEDLPLRAEVFKVNLTKVLAENPDQLFFVGVETDIGESQKAQIMPIHKALDEIRDMKNANGKPLFPNLMIRRAEAKELAAMVGNLNKEGKLNLSNTFIGAKKLSVDNKVYDGIKGEGRAWIAAIDDSKSGDYLPVFEAITLNLMAYLNADLAAIKNFYDTVSEKPIDPDTLRDMLKNRIIYILPKPTAFDTKQLRELYELARQVYIAA